MSIRQFDLLRTRSFLFEFLFRLHHLWHYFCIVTLSTMFRHSSLSTSCLLLAVTLLGTSFGSPINDTSGELLSSFAQSKVLLMGVLGHNLMIITKDTPPMVYQVPMDKYGNSQIDLYGVVPVELKDKWPILYSNDNFTKRVLNGEIVQSFSIGMDKETFVFAFNSHANVFLETVTFAIKPPSATYQEFKIYDAVFNLMYSHLISSDEPNVFFNVRIVDERIYQLVKYIQKADGFSIDWKFDMCKKSDGNGSDVIVFETTFTNCANMQYVDWEIENGGFMYQNRFHLFTKDQVYIFEYTGGSSSGVVLTVVKLTDFFIRIIPTTTTTTIRSTTKKATHMMFFIIVAIVVGGIVIALIVLVIWVFCCKKSKPKPKPQNNVHKSKDTKQTVKNSTVLNKCSTASNAMSQKQTQVFKGSSMVAHKSSAQSSPKKVITSVKMPSKVIKSKVSKVNSSQASKPKASSSPKEKSKSKTPNVRRLPKLTSGVPKSESPLRIEFTKTELTFPSESEVLSMIPNPSLPRSQIPEYQAKVKAQSLAKIRKRSRRRRSSRKAKKSKQEKKATIAKQATQSKHSKASKPVKPKAGSNVSKSSSSH